MKPFFRSFWGAFLGSLVALGLLFFLFFQLIGSLASVEKAEPLMPKSAILKIDFKAPVTEQKSSEFSFDILSGGPSFGESISLLDVVRAIDAAAQDPAIKFIYMTPDYATVSLSQAEEIREALDRFRASGKAVVSYSKAVSTGTYYLASIADKAILNPYADCLFSGLTANVMYYKDLIDKLGIDVQLIRHGKYKSAGEPYIASQMSDANREQYQVMLNTIWNVLAEGAAEHRPFSKDDFTRMVNNLEIKDGEGALEAGLFDELWFDDQVEAYLCDLYGVSKAKQLKYVTLEEYAEAKVKPDLKVKDKIAVIFADGEIAMNDKDTPAIGDYFAKTIAKVRRDSSVKAVVFRVNSPGGSVQASAIIEREIALLKEVKPVIASYGDYAASGGYWISCGCDKIFTDKTTLTGSIGVFGLMPSVGRAVAKNLHINTFEVSTSPHGSFYDMMHPLDNAEVAWMQNNIETTYADFVARVSAGRDMSAESVDAIAQGRVWAGSDAIQIGLVDEIGTLSKAISYAASSVGLESYRIEEYPQVKGIYEKLMESMGPAEHDDNVVKAEPADAMLKACEWAIGISKPEVMARMESIILK
ncbi:MAG: signal peptide peptidase SppA [Bacteroidales bacterium]|nr:signal peptide peptidase SppA [Candidatus Cacconaster merdequi]